VCTEGIETIFYALLDCVRSNEAWAKTQYQHMLEETPRQAMSQFHQWIYDKSEANTVKAVAMGTYTMWTAQNNVIFKGKNSNREVLVASFMECVKKGAEYREIVEVEVAREKISMSPWEASPRGCVKINIDAHVNVLSWSWLHYEGSRREASDGGG